MFTSALIALALSASAFANIFITEPTATTIFTAGEDSQIAWKDDGESPSLQELGNCEISIYVGNLLEQTNLQTISPSTDVSQQSTLTFKPDPSIGPNSTEYFIRFQSLNAKDPNNSQLPALGFSAKFRMDDMTGAFSDQVQQQIAGQSSAPLQGATSTSAPAAASSSNSSNKPSSSAAPSKSASSAKPSASQGAASGIRASAGMVLAGAGAIAGAALF